MVIPENSSREKFREVDRFLEQESPQRSFQVKSVEALVFGWAPKKPTTRPHTRPLGAGEPPFR
jgi:hypothetical protein